ncbi:MAG: hypothetical protein H6737_18565 [Alphaproteobacteria bacterium]|nr:hypothetical protein [Alphaproteobacteria bacterium]
MSVELPDPEALETVRQEHVRERFVHRVGVMALTVVLYVNLTGGAIGGVLYGFGPLSSVLIGAALAGLPLVGLLALNRRAQRHERAARETIAWLLGSRVESGWPTRLATLSASVLVGLGVVLALRYDMARAGSLAFVGFGIVAPFLRKRNTPEIPTWAMAVMGAWIAGGGLFVLLMPTARVGFNVATVWLIVAPFGLPLFLLRNRLVEWAGQEGSLGNVARVLAAFLPTAQTARLRREAGDVDGSLAAMQAQFTRPLARQLLFDAVLEVSETLLALGDPRALPAFAALARIAPSDPRPFTGLARVLRSEDPERALAYARFAEENAARTLSGGDAAVTALRESIERGDPEGGQAGRV